MTQCVCLVDERGNRTMRPCLKTAVKIQVNMFFSLECLVLLYPDLNLWTL